MENTAAEPKTRGLIDRNALKYIVIVAMVFDHIAWGFEAQLAPVVCQIFHFVGRLTGPTMAFFLTEGYIHTRNAAKYQLRLGIFAVISWLPYVFFEAGVDEVLRSPDLLMMQSVMYTLFLGITALRVYDSKKLNKGDKIVIITVLCFLSLVGDWMIMDVLAPLVMYACRDKKIKEVGAAGAGLLAESADALPVRLVQSWRAAGAFDDRALLQRQGRKEERIQQVVLLRFLSGAPGGHRGVEVVCVLR